ALESQTKSVVEGFDKWRERLKQVIAAAREKRYDEVLRLAGEVRDAYPEYVEAGSAYELLAEAHLARGDKAAAAAELERYARAGGRNPECLKRLARLHAEAGRKREAAAALARLV